MDKTTLRERERQTFNFLSAMGIRDLITGKKEDCESVCFFQLVFIKSSKDILLKGQRHNFVGSPFFWLMTLHQFTFKLKRVCKLFCF